MLSLFDQIFQRIESIFEKVEKIIHVLKIKITFLYSQICFTKCVISFFRQKLHVYTKSIALEPATMIMILNRDEQCRVKSNARIHYRSINCIHNC